MAFTFSKAPDQNTLSADAKELVGSQPSDLQRWYDANYKAWESRTKELGRLLESELEPLRNYGCLLVSVDCRVKTIGSIARKAHAEYLKGLGQPGSGGPVQDEAEKLRDIVGARVIGLNLQDVVTLARHVLAIDEFVWRRGEIKNYYEHARPSGYRSWQIQLKWGDNWIEVQVRTPLEHAWAEWEHDLFYKRKPHLSLSASESLRMLLDQEKKSIADGLFQIAKRLDVIRDTFDVALLSVPEHITRHLTSLTGQPLDSDLQSRLRNRFKVEISALNLDKGLRAEEVAVDWSREFYGLELNDAGLEKLGSQAAERFARDELAERFAFDELSGLQENHDEVFIKPRFPGPSKVTVSADEFARKSQDLLLACYRSKRDPHLTFFNEYLARLAEWASDLLPPANAHGVRLRIHRTNFAYEVCTTYVLESGRTICPDTNRAEQSDVAAAKAELGTVEWQSFLVEHAANPIAVHVNLIHCPAPDGNPGGPQLIIALRGKRAALHQDQWSTAVSGVMVPTKEGIESAGDIPGLAIGVESGRTEGGRSELEKPSVFRAAQRELQEELGLRVPTDHVRFIALLRDEETKQPIAVMEAYTSDSLDEIKQRWETAVEKWEVAAEAVDGESVQTGNAAPENKKPVLFALPLKQEGLDQLFSGCYVAPDVRLVPPTEVPAGSNGRVWQARSAAAVLLTFCRYVGAAAVKNKLG